MFGAPQPPAEKTNDDRKQGRVHPEPDLEGSASEGAVMARAHGRSIAGMVRFGIRRVLLSEKS